MRIEKIEKTADSFNIYRVTFSPNWLERLFKVPEKIKLYKDTGSTYRFGSGHVYVDQTGEKLENGDWIAEAIDKWRNKF